jgi:hypothetical protein
VAWVASIVHLGAAIAVLAWRWRLDPQEGNGHRESSLLLKH